MICFGKTRIRVSSNDTVELSCDTWTTFEHSDLETITFGTPEYWDEAIQSVCSPGYIVLEIYEKVLPRSVCNRLTDYKQVWGLLGLPKGEFSARVDCGEKTVYIGASKDLKLRKESKACRYLLLPMKYESDVEGIWKTFCEIYAERQCNDFVGVARNIVASNPCVIALYYTYTEQATLTVICNAPNCIAKTLETAQKPEVIMPHYRDFLS